MSKSNPLRWVPFSRRLPPVGVLVQVKSFKSWRSANCTAVVRRVKAIAVGSDILGIEYMEREGTRGPWHCYSTTEYQRHASWRYASGKIPSVAALEHAKKKIERLERDWARATKRQRAKDLVAVRARIVREYKRQDRLDKLPISEVPRPASGSHKIHYKRFPEDFRLKGDPYLQAEPTCGSPEGGYLTLDRRLVTCGRCLRSLEAYYGPMRVTIHTRVAAPRSAY